MDDDKKKDDQDNMKDKDKKNNEDIAALTSQIEQLNQEKQDLFEKLQRIGADYANYQKRVPKQIADSVAYEKRVILKSLLASIDNFEIAITNLEKDGTCQKIIEGIRMAFNHMLDAFKTHGLEVIETVGSQFNPEFHEALMRRCENDKPDNVVLEEFCKGYLINGQVLRPSRVAVNQYQTAPEQTSEDQQQEETQ